MEKKYRDRYRAENKCINCGGPKESYRLQFVKCKECSLLQSASNSRRKRNRMSITFAGSQTRGGVILTVIDNNGVVTEIAYAPDTTVVVTPIRSAPDPTTIYSGASANDAGSAVSTQLVLFGVSA